VAATVSPFFSVTPEPPKPNKPPGVLVGPDGVFGSVCCIFRFTLSGNQISLLPVGFPLVGVFFPVLGIVGVPEFPTPPFTFTTAADTLIVPMESPKGLVFPPPPEPPVIRSYRLFPPLNSFSPPDNPRNPAK